MNQQIQQNKNHWNFGKLPTATRKLKKTSKKFAVSDDNSATIWCEDCLILPMLEPNTAILGFCYIQDEANSLTISLYYLNISSVQIET